MMILLISCDAKNEMQEPKNMVDSFFLSYEKDGCTEALNNIFLTNSWLLEYSKDEIENLKNSLYSHINLIGKYCGYEIISERSIGNNLKHYSCMVKYERQPLRFSFVFYKANSSWVLYNFKYDDNLIEELEESAKFYYFD